MKISKLTTYIVPPRWCFLKIETDEGISGWGEPVLEGRVATVEALVHELGDYLIGKDPLLIEDHWNVLYRSGFYRGGGIHMSALAGIDQALWDIKGKAANLPVHAQGFQQWPPAPPIQVLPNRKYLHQFRFSKSTNGAERYMSSVLLFS
jgi:galactonate dehydratase